MEYSRLDDGLQEDEDAFLLIPRVPHGPHANTDEPVSGPSSSRPLSSASVRTEKQLTKPGPNAQTEPLLPPLRYRRTTIYLLLPFACYPMGLDLCARGATSQRPVVHQTGQRAITK